MYWNKYLLKDKEVFMQTDIKKVTYKHLKKGQELKGWSKENCSVMGNAIVQEVNPAFVSVLMWNKYPEKIASEGTTFEIEMTEAEFQKKYMKEAKKIINALNNNLADYEIGYHENWNAWVYYDLEELDKEGL
jgi:uncharacterized pyridoxamine 5'-phosphate oxidase family protein